MANRCDSPPTESSGPADWRGDWTLETRLADRALYTAECLTRYDGLGRDETIAQVIREAEQGLEIREPDVEVLDELNGITAYGSGADQFAEVYEWWRDELGFPIGDHARERCLAIVRRALEACPDLSRGQDFPCAGPWTVG